tara:strand:- start:212 stop:847 length:636 start_codon:yes stop_codon:yes gene_type:complete
LKKIIVTIDGPAASGKGRIAKYISRRWKLKHLDSGILYRRLAFLLNKHDININSLKEIKDFVNNLEDISFKKHKNLRNEKISKISSQIAVHKFVRIFVNSIQKKIVNKNLKRTGFVIDGRDIGSIVFKHADLKLYIDVNEQNRAKRRYKQLIVTGEKSIYPKILKDIKLRDKKDKSRKNSPLVIPNGAYVIDNNGSFQKTIHEINKLIGKI